MTDHETFRLLIAKGLHERLTPEESGSLEAHHSTCPSCRRFEIELRHDDMRLRAALTEAPVAARVRRTVLDSAAGRRRTDPRLGLAVAAALLIGLIGLPVLVGGGDRAPTAAPSVSAAPATPGPTSSQAPVGSQSADPSTSPSASASRSRRGSVDGAYAYTVAPWATASIGIHLGHGLDPDQG